SDAESTEFPGNCWLILERSPSLAQKLLREGRSMKVGVPTEIRVDEYRVAMPPAGVRELVDAGHEVYVQQGAGLGSAISDEAYVKQGAKILPDASAVFAEAEMIVKVKEPQPVEVAMLEP